MSIEIRGPSGRPVNVGDSSQPASVEQKGQSGTANAHGASQDTVSLTGSATLLQQLESQVANLPVADPVRVSDVQRALATGSFEFEPEEAADNLLTQERELATLEAKE